ncbi:uncharacterized protein LOC128990900 [Macrosteles quadrilineatus]|uniref:uncharacterized protein LOC128990900 n=1 Tax=Macrosteles quadrilineatus TaxID=74068 RepID=UPI0023E1130B|nr:uncharacterized protein LOC128990900 [Macrosteles quadrilineatus]
MKVIWLHFITLGFFIIVCGCKASTKSENKLLRIKRQQPGDAFIDAIFQVPIMTLSSVGTLIKTSRPVIMNVRKRIIESLTPPQQNGQRPQRYTPQQVAGDRVGLTNSFFNKLHNQPHRFSFSPHRTSSNGNRIFRES